MEGESYGPYEEHGDGLFSFLAMAIIIVACVLSVCFCCCFVYCLWSCCRSEDCEKTQVVPISIIETDSINQK